MKIVEISTNGNGKVSGGKKVLGAAEKWVFDTENGEVRLKALMNMSAGQQGVAELEEFKTYGSDAEKSYGLDIALNRVFIIATEIFIGFCANCFFNVTNETVYLSKINIRSLGLHDFI